jgi:hypothetical protein
MFIDSSSLLSGEGGRMAPMLAAVNAARAVVVGVRQYPRCVSGQSSAEIYGSNANAAKDISVIRYELWSCAALGAPIEA